MELQLLYGVDKLTVSAMDNLEQQVLDNLTITRRSWFLDIPHDLLMDILTRNPVKSIARLRCVSKIWESIIRGPDFTELFLSRSLSHPRLLFTFIENQSRLYIFSTPQPQNKDENSSLVAVADRHKNIFVQETNGICRPVNGLVCTENREWRDAVPMICNPSTGQSMTLPRFRTRKLGEKRSLGYDPIDKQFKLLNFILVNTGRYTADWELHILTFGNGESLWREIERSVHHFSPYEESICINGVLYYPVTAGGSKQISLIACFDVKSESFRFVNIPEGLEMGEHSILINYKGKLGALRSKRGIDYEMIDGSVGFLKLWVLDDLEKHLWSTKMYQLPSMWRNIIQNYTNVVFVGMACTGEFVLSPTSFSGDPFYVFFYHPDKNIVVRVEIQGTERIIKQGKFQTFIDYIEDVNLCKLIA